MEVQLDLNLGDTEAGDLGTLEYNTGSGWVAVPVDGIVSVPAGMTQFDVRIASIDDEVYEGPENFTVDVTGLGPVQGTDTGTATIVDDGTGPGPDPDDDRPGVTISDAGVINEGDTANFVVTLANVSEDDVQVELSLNLGDTEAGDLGSLEYNTGSGWVAVPVDGVVTVPAGLTEFDVRIASIDDEVYEYSENFTVDVTGLGPVQGADTGTATIVDDGTGPEPDPDDDRPTVSISDAGTINEGDTANFVVSLTNASEAPVEVQLDLNLGDTEAGDLGTLEYNTGSGWVAVPVSGVVTVPAGLTEFDVRIASIDDEVYEGPENFTVDVTGLDLFKALTRAQPLSSMTVQDQTQIRTTTAQRFLLATLARLTKVTLPTSLSRSLTSLKLRFRFSLLLTLVTPKQATSALSNTTLAQVG